MNLRNLNRIPIRETAARILADVFFLGVSLFLGFSTYLVGWVIVLRQYPNSARIREAFEALYVQNIVLMVAIGVLVFTLSGFYTHTRAYRGRFKLLVIFNAVSLTFLLHSFLQYFLLRLPPIPRGVTLLAWFFSLLTIGGSRVFKGYVTRNYSIERRAAQGERPVRRVLVIGGAGYIGSVMVRRLLDEGYSVRVMDMVLFGDQSIRPLFENPKFELFREDFRHVESVVKAVQGMDAVIHLGAIVGDPACQLNSKLTLETNLASTTMIKEVCCGAGIQRFLFASSCSVYGASDHLLDERSVLNPISLYACTKVDAERVILGKRVGEFAPTVLRLGTAFGFSYRPRFDLVVNVLAARAIQEKKIAIFNKTQWRPLIHVEDIAEAFLACLRAPLPAIAYETFNVGSYALNHTLEEVAAAIQTQVTGVEVEYIEKTSDQRNYRVSFDKIHTTLGFTCRKTLDDGIAEIKVAFDSGLVSDYRNPIYYNDRSLEQMNVQSLQEEIEGTFGESEKFLRGSAAISAL